jgi:uncharacterized protein YpmS
MIISNEYTQGVIGVTSLARSMNTSIGSYLEHYINEDFGFTVRLSNNGAIRMSRAIAEDYENEIEMVTDDRVENVAKSYRVY